MPHRKNSHTPGKFKQLTKPKTRNSQQMSTQEQIHPWKSSYVASKEQCQFFLRNFFSNHWDCKHFSTTENPPLTFQKSTTIVPTEDWQCHETICLGNKIFKTVLLIYLIYSFHIGVEHSRKFGNQRRNLSPGEQLSTLFTSNQQHEQTKPSIFSQKHTNSFEAAISQTTCIKGRKFFNKIKMEDVFYHKPCQ